MLRSLGCWHNLLAENRNNTPTEFQTEPASGYAERRVAITMVYSTCPAAAKLRWPWLAYPHLRRVLPGTQRGTTTWYRSNHASNVLSVKSFYRMSERFEGFVDGFAPDEGLEMTVVEIETTADGVFEFMGTAVGSAPKLLFGQHRELALYQIEPGCTGKGKLQVKARMAREPAFAAAVLWAAQLPMIKWSSSRRATVSSVAWRNSRNSIAWWC